MTTVTQWFDGMVNPVHEGSYECGFVHGDGTVNVMCFPMHKYTAKNGWSDMDGLSVMDGLHVSLQRLYDGSLVVWRGLAEKPQP
jgi:hypothetical protein